MNASEVRAHVATMYPAAMQSPVAQAIEAATQQYVVRAAVLTDGSEVYDVIENGPLMLTVFNAEDRRQAERFAYWANNPEYEFRGHRIPARMMLPLLRYAYGHEAPGHFLTAVICNNLSDAVGRGDRENVSNLPAYVGWLYNEAPSQCWGSVAKFNAWVV